MRLRDIGEARIALNEPVPPFSAPVAAPPARSPWPWIAAVCGVAALTFGFLYFARPSQESRAVKLDILPPEKSIFVPIAIPAVSPDGLHVAFETITDGKYQLWVRDLDSRTPRLLSGSDVISYPFWSPDSRTIAFFAAGHLKKIDVGGGPTVTVCEAPSGRGGTWNQSDVMVFAGGVGAGLSRVSATGGSPAPVTTVDVAAGETFHRFPSFLPDGHRFLYLVGNNNPEKRAVWVSDLNSRERRRVVPASSNAVYAVPGFLLFARERTLMTQPFDPVTSQTAGEAVPLGQRVDSYPAAYQSRALFSVSRNGVLVYSSGGGGGTQLTWFERSGKPLGTVGPPGEVNWPSISPDGKTVATFRNDPQTGVSDIWLHDLARSSSYRLTSHPKGASYFPMWSGDGSFVGFGSDWEGTTKLYRKGHRGQHRRGAM